MVPGAEGQEIGGPGRMVSERAKARDAGKGGRRSTEGQKETGRGHRQVNHVTLATKR